MSEFLVPANSSRYFNSKRQALEQPLGKLNYVPSPEGYFFNITYNRNVVKYDETYQTENSFQLKRSIKCFETILPKLSSYSFVEIGCGQGEFVNYLISIGKIAYGFDPVCRAKSVYLFNEFFDINLIPKIDEKIVFVMRCVLPHIEQPFEFIDNIFRKYPSALILMQHQRVEHFLKTRSWNSLMHDHVNVFQDSDFDDNYKVHSKIMFAKNEWQQILIGKKNRVSTPNKRKEIDFFEQLQISRSAHLATLREHEEVYLFGAAGKGINFAYACTQNKIEITAAIDDQASIWGKYMDSSGVQVVSPKEVKKSLWQSSLIVMNHSHLESARRRFSNLFEVYSLKTL